MVASKLSIYRNKIGERNFIQAYDDTLSHWQAEYESMYVATKFGDTHIIACGKTDAPPLLLLHGFGFSSTMWIDNMPSLSQHYRVYAVDFIGDLNKSVATKQIQSIADCVQWFEDVLHGLGLDRANLLGMSYGGFLAFQFAIHAPDRVSKLIAISPGASLLPQKKLFFLRCLVAGFVPTTGILSEFMNWMCAKGNQVNGYVQEQFIIAMKSCIPKIKVFASYIEDEDLRNIQCLTLLLIGEYEVQYDPEKAIERAKILIPHLQYKLVENVGHGMPFEKPMIVNELVINFLAE
jgi:pimeloyl-ACP methyl ester carboxylesterase